MNTLVLLGSVFPLVEAIYINDRGEIAGNAVLANVDVQRFLLIRCNENHVGDGEGCEERRGGNSLLQTHRASRAAPSGTTHPLEDH